MKHDRRHDINQEIRRMSAYFSFDLLLAAFVAAIYTRESASQILREFLVIQTSPSPLVTDYFRLGSLPAALLNAGLCGLCCVILLEFRWVIHRPSVWAGFFLIIAHAFYGLNLVNMWPPILGYYLYCKLHKLPFRHNLDKAMFITSFGPFFSEILFRYPLTYSPVISIFGIDIQPVRLILCAVMAVFVGLTLPAMLPGAAKFHRGYNLYNAGLATGLLAMFLYAFMYKTMGVTPEGPLQVENAFYEAHGSSYMLFGNVFFILLSTACILYGWSKNGSSFKGYGDLLKESSRKANFLRDYELGLTWINLGFYCLMMLAYFDIVISFTEGAGFTGPTFGIIFAAMTFSAGGQHPKNVWPILLGYAALSGFIHIECLITARAVPWTLSTQGYMNGIAFATGLCPIAGKHGWKLGVLAGFVNAVLCSVTSAMHGGFVLYNGGLTAGITALLIVPLIDTYVTHTINWGQVDIIPRPEDIDK